RGLVELLALPVSNVLDRRAGQPHAAVKAREQARILQHLHVAPYRLQRHAELVGQRLDRDRAASAHLLEQQGLAWVRRHVAAVTDKLMAAQHNQHPVSCDGGFRACNVFVLQVKTKREQSKRTKTNIKRWFVFLCPGDGLSSPSSQTVDVLVVGGGINGAGIARDFAGRGLSVLL